MDGTEYLPTFFFEAVFQSLNPIPTDFGYMLQILPKI
jgi:hypothetical protein